MQETWVQSLGGEDSLEEGMATHSRILAWRIPMDKEKPGGLVHGVAKSDTTKHGGRGWGGRQREQPPSSPGFLCSLASSARCSLGQGHQTAISQIIEFSYLSYGIENSFFCGLKLIY